MQDSFIWAFVAVDRCLEHVTSLVNQARRHTGRICSMVTSCHRNVPIVEKLRDRSKKEKERGTHSQAGMSKEEKDVQQISWRSVPLKHFMAFPLTLFCIIISMYACLCDRRVGY